MSLFPDLRYNIIRLFEDNISQREIGRKLSIGISTVNYVIQKYVEHDAVDRLNESGRRRSLDAADKKDLIDMINENPRISAKRIANKKSGESGKLLSAQTIRNCIKVEGFNGRVARKVPLLSKKY